jgi:hypothetical protein
MSEVHVVKPYFDTCIQSGRLRGDLKPAEMDAVRALEKADREAKIKIVGHNPTLRAQLVQSNGDTAVVTKDHELLGFHNQMDRLGTVSVSPLITDIVDEPLFKSLTDAGLKKGDARQTQSE